LTIKSLQLIHRVSNFVYPSMTILNRIVRKKKKQHLKSGLPPGTAVFTGEDKSETAETTVVQYNEASINIDILKGFDCPKSSDEVVTWFDIRGLSDVALIEHIGKAFNVHPLAVEDVLNTNQRPKWDDYDNGIFITVRALRLHESREIITEQVSFFLEKDVLLTFQEDADDLFKVVRGRMQNGQGKMRQKRTDYLMYALLDCIVDEYITLLDHLEDKIDALENEILTHFTPSVRNQIYHFKQQLTLVRRAVFPMRDVIGRFARETGEIVEPANQVYIRDLYDHVARVIETVENQRDMLNNLDDLYNSEQSNRANHIMKVLTIVSAIFIPLTFIVGVYGTNFEVLPELHYPHAYTIMWIGMVFIAIVQLIYFRWKKWL
jgi:magnesium transporter